MGGGSRHCLWLPLDIIDSSMTTLRNNKIVKPAKTLLKRRIASLILMKKERKSIDVKNRWRGKAKPKVGNFLLVSSQIRDYAKYIKAKPPPSAHHRHKKAKITKN